MGWSSSSSREAEVQKYAGPWKAASGQTVESFRHHRNGIEDWFLFEVRDEEGNTVDSYISVMIWDGDYHKEMDEACRPFYYGCPVEWFDRVPYPKAQAWRDAVREAKNARKVPSAYIYARRSA